MSRQRSREIRRLPEPGAWKRTEIQIGLGITFLIVLLLMGRI